MRSQMANSVKYPAPGCVVEYLEDNAIHIAMILEESGGKLRLLLPSRREVKMSSNRLLPWYGPLHSSGLGKEEAVRILEGHRKLREERTAQIKPLEVWEVAAGEIGEAQADWFAELFESDPDADWVAAFGRALLACKTHFHFRPPEFEVYGEELVQKRLEEQRAREEKAALIAGGAGFLQKLWSLAQSRQTLGAEDKKEVPSDKVCDRILKMLHARMLDPESQEDAGLWEQLAKSLPDVPHLSLQLLTAWGKVPPHYNFWLERADFEPGDEWHRGYEGDVAALAQASGGGRSAGGLELEDLTALPFISIDGASTLDIDDAFFIEANEDGYSLLIALAFPALCWPFGSAFDKKILHRATSLYLPEQTCHMLPESLGIGAYSLFEGKERPAFCLRVNLDKKGRVTAFEPFAAKVRLAANLHYSEVQAVLAGTEDGRRAQAFLEPLKIASELAQKREDARIEAGAVIMQKPDPVIILQGEGEEVRVDLITGKQYPDAQRLVSEMMVLASASLADWALEHDIALVHRTQNLTLPREYAGRWSQPEDLARIGRAFMPSILEVEARPHAALALPRYAPVTSPLRRYADLLNEAQILKYLESGKPRWSREELEQLLGTLTPSLDAVSQAQKFRPRYWKLLYFRQHGDQEWWPAVITEENENFVNVSLPEKGLFVRGKRQQFDERACPGMKIQVRLGKVNPLYNEIHIMEVMPDE